MIQIKFVKNITKFEWLELLNNSSDATMFHTFEWLEVLTQTYPHYKKKFIFAFENEKILAALPIIIIKEKWALNKYYSLPFGTYGGVILRNGVEEKVRNEVLKKFAQSTQKITTGVLRLTDFSGQNSFLEKLNFNKKQSFTLILNLDKKLNEIWEKDLSSSARTKTRQAEKYEITIEEVNSLEKIKECYKMLEETDKRHGYKKSIFPLELLINIYHIMGKENLIKWFIANYNGNFIAHLLSFKYKNSLMAWLAGSYQDFWKYRPNNLLFWHLISWGHQNNYTSVNISAVPNQADGLLFFKKQWGTKEKYYYLYEKYSLLSCLFNKLKNVSNKVIKIK